jgi:hypothetical protein
MPVKTIRFAIPAALLLSFGACSDDDTVTSSRGALVRIAVDAPAAARSGENFGVRIEAQNVGVTNVHDGRVQVTLPAPLTVTGVDASAGTSATFTNGPAVATVSWTLNTLDSNSQSILTVRAVGALPAGQPARRLTIEASMTGEGIRAGDAVARDDMDLTP